VNAAAEKIALDNHQRKEVSLLAIIAANNCEVTMAFQLTINGDRLASMSTSALFQQTRYAGPVETGFREIW
jgi:hypothetical protein